MREEARLTSGFIAGMDYNAFIHNEMVKRAVTQTLANIGELTRKVSDVARKSQPEIPWPAIRKTRNVIAHDYEEVDFIEIWHTASVSIPELIAVIDRIERDLGEPLYGDREQTRNQQMIVQAIEEADAQDGKK
jgi:uncharacterized protein with HEPN domain